MKIIQRIKALWPLMTKRRHAREITEQRELTREQANLAEYFLAKFMDATDVILWPSPAQLLLMAGSSYTRPPQRALELRIRPQGAFITIPLRPCTIKDMARGAALLEEHAWKKLSPRIREDLRAACVAAAEKMSGSVIGNR